jgi:hypothetical protein
MHELSFILWEETRLTVFGNRALRRMFGPKRNEVRGYCCKTLSEELHDQYSPPNFLSDKIEKNVMGAACSTLRGEGRCKQDFDGEI